MSKDAEEQERISHETRDNEPPPDHGAGDPAGTTVPETTEPGQLPDTPSIGAEEQEPGKTEHPAPPDETGVPDDPDR